MADSEKKNTQKLPGDFADELDSMLDDAASSMNNTEELMDDDDAIDQLLMDNTLEIRDQSGEEDDDLDDLFAEDSIDFDLEDEFGPGPEPIAEEKKPEEPQSDAESAEPVSESNEFIEIDEFAEEPVPPTSMAKSQDDDDFTVAEFDISYDDSSIDEADSIDAATDPVASAVGESRDEPITPNRKMVEATAIDPTIAAQISQLFIEQAALKQQLAGISTAAETDHSNEIERLANGQHMLRKQVDKASGKAVIIGYSALGIAIIALVMAGVLAYSGWDSSAGIDELAQRVVNLEDNQEALIGKNSDKEINEINAKIDQQNQTLTELSAQLAALTGTGEEESASSPLKTLSEDLSAAISQQKTLNDSMTALEARVKRLETKTPPTVARSKVAGKTSGAHDWSVNLVSFRQKWYANRKAAEFAKKGIRAEVVAVQVKGEPWYRLTVKGFKSKSDASVYAAQVKKNFNLDSVWLGKD